MRRPLPLLSAGLGGIRPPRVIYRVGRVVPSALVLTWQLERSKPALLI